MSGSRALVVATAAAVVFPAAAQNDPFPVNRQPGTLVYWYTGTGTFPQSAMPHGRFTKVDGRWIRLIALREDGAALSWRAESWGGTSADFNLRPGPYRDVKISDNMLLLKKPDHAWDAFFPPNEGGAPFNPPIPPLPFVNADCALYYGAGLDFTGQIWAWGWNNVGQSDCPPGPFLDVACLQMTTAGLRPDGTVELWGQHAGVIDAPDVVRIKSANDSLFGQTTTGEIVCLRACDPASIPREPVWDFDPRDGDSGLVWILRDGRGFMSPGTVPETRWQDITTTVGGGEALGVVDTDCDGSGFYDRGEIAAGLISDCNGNLIPDACETARQVIRTGEWLGQLFGGQSVSFDMTELPTSARGVRLDVEAKGDLFGDDRSLEVQFGEGGPAFTLFADGGRACWQLGRDWAGIELSAEQFEQVLGDSDSLAISITPSDAVASKSCTDGGLWLRLEYVANAPEDCNGNGIDDACEIASGTVPDDDGDGVPDNCSGGCAADLDGDLAVSGADLAVLLSGWGQKGTTDLTGDGITDGADLASLLSAWGSCP